MNKIKLMMKNIKTAFSNAIIGYHRELVYVSLGAVEMAKINGDDEALKYWEGRYIKHGMKVPEFKGNIQDWLKRNK